MKEEQDKWIGGFRRRMQDYSEPVPTQLWEQLNAELERPKVVLFYARWRMIAAVALLVVVSTLTLWLVNAPSADYAEELSKQVRQLAESHLPANRETDGMAGQMNAAQPLSETSKRMAMNVAPVREHEALSEKEHEEHEQVEPFLKMEQEETETEPLKAKDEEQRKEKPAVERGRIETEKTASGARRPGYSFKASPSKQSSQASWEVGVSVGNVPASVSNTSPGYKNLPRPKPQHSMLMSDPSFEPNGDMEGDYNHIMSPVNGNSEVYVLNQILSNNVQNTVVSDIKHRMPVTVGASVRIHFDDKWACETGLTYTLLSSDIRAGGNSDYYETEQQLHYLGLPLKASYKVWESNRFSFYISAGGAVEKCVSGKMKTVYTADGQEQMSSSEDLKVKPLQWSLSSAVGAQFKLSKQLGIYAEPGVAYYFNDGSEVQTIRKEHPFNFNLQLGIRLSY